MSQSPTAGTPAPKGSTVSITSARSPAAPHDHHAAAHDHDGCTTTTTADQHNHVELRPVDGARPRQSASDLGEEVAQQVVAADREDRLGVELHALDGQLAVAQRP